MSRLIVWTKDEQGHYHATGTTATGKTVAYELTPVVRFGKRRYTVVRDRFYGWGWADLALADAKREVEGDFTLRFDDVEDPDRLPRRFDNDGKID